MDEEVLSQRDVVSLLNHTEAPKSGASSPRAKKPIPYDFKKPERVGKEQIQVLQSLHEGLARNFGVGLSSMLRCMVEVKLTSVEQLPYSEFVFSLENPTCFNVLRADPLEGSLILDINPSILYPIIDRLLGGGKESSAPSRRALTEIELRLVSRITKLFLAEFTHAWQSVVALEMSVERVESNPLLAQIVSRNEAVVLIIFEVTIGETRGIMNLCIPFNTIERFSNKLQSNSWATSHVSAATAPESQRRIGQRLGRSDLKLVVTLADTKIKTSDLIGLRVGDIITTEKDVNHPLTLAIEGVTKFYATAGSFKGRKAVQIEQAAGEYNKKSST